MKILAIRLKNLASLAGEQVIDFTAEPLASAGLFAITGPTGAGKSTLLDALCLALFGSTPRLQNVSPQNKVPDGNEELGGSDDRNLLRRGCASGYAEVDFVGVDRRRYRARWEVKRAREKTDGRLQPSSQSLLDLDSNQLLVSGKKREFEALVSLKLGLNLAQFTRAVLLAQSEFSAFLKAKDDERGSLLEKLTDTGLYSRLGQASFEVAKRSRESLAQLQQQLDGVQPLDAEARQALEVRHAELQDALKTAQQRLKALEQQRQWHLERTHLERERDQAQVQLQQAESTYERLAADRHTLALFEQLAPQRHRFSRRNELQQQLTKTDEVLVRLDSAVQQLRSRLISLEEARELAHLQLQSADQARREAEPRIIQARRDEAHLRHLETELQSARQEAGQITVACEAIQARRQDLETEQQANERRLTELATQLQSSASLQALCVAWDGYRPRLQQAVQLAARLQQGTSELPALEQRAHEAQTKQEQARAALDDLNSQLGGEVSEQLTQLSQQLENWRSSERDLESLHRLWNDQQHLQTRLTETQQARARLQAELEALVPEGQQARQERDAAEQALKTILDLLERQRLARSERVEALRATLVPGEPCPVCGSGEHPWHQADVMLATFQQQDDQEAERARLALTTQDQRLQALRDRHTVLTTQLKQAQERQTEFAVALETLKPKLEAFSLHGALMAQPEDSRGSWLVDELSAVRERIASAGQTQTNLLQLQQRRDALLQAWQDAREQCTLMEQQVSQQRDALLRDRQRLDDELAAFASLLPDAWIDDWRQNSTQAFIKLDSDIAVRLQLLQSQAELTEEQRQCHDKIKDAQREHQHLQERQTACTARLAEREQQWQACKLNLQDVLGEQSSVEQWQQQLETALQAAREQQESVERQLNDVRVELARLTSEQHNTTQRRDELKQEHSSLLDELAIWQDAHPQLDEDTCQQLLKLEDKELEEIRRQLEENAQVLTRFRERLEGCLQRLAAHQAKSLDTPDTDTLEQEHARQLARCEEAERHCTEARALLFDDDNRRQQGQALLAQIDAANAEHQRWARIAALIGSADGSAFRRIAQVYNLDLLVQHANIQLQQLARRYRLKRGGSPLGLLVMDREMGDELRSVYSLSGGETFLVSLALALGLASMASSKLHIESLFIDEGFGSLDPESLQIAMDALDALQAQGRKVAVISHVAQMHERIPVQVQVLRQGNGRSTLRVTDGFH